ncbi:MAG: hypothetical protein ABI378_09035 [Chitinophagaceae bacterium]
MKLKEVLTAADKAAFLKLAATIYKNDPHWIRPLDKDIEAVFDPTQNKFFKKGECTRWLLLDDSDTPIGRIAAFVNNQYKQSQPTGGIGFFECSNDFEAAKFMFDHCKNWLQERGMEAMDGPINFGERLAWWGLLTEGFYEPLYQMNYNPPYYQQLFEQYGFQLYFNQICFARTVAGAHNGKYEERHARLSEDKDYSIKPIKKSQLKQFAKDFAYVYNKAWAGHGGGKQIEERVAYKMFNNMKAVMDEKISWFAYYKDEPIAIWVNLPDLNQWFKHLHGKFGILQKLKFLFLKKFGKCDRFVGLVFGIIPEFQGKGVDAYLVLEAAKVIQAQKKYLSYEMQWIGDFNPKMINIAETLDSKPSRILVTYRYLFDREKEFKRHPIL